VVLAATVVFEVPPHVTVFVGIAGRVTVVFGVFVPLTVAPVDVMVLPEDTFPVTVEPLDNVTAPLEKTCPVNLLVFAADKVVPDPTELDPVAVTNAPVLRTVLFVDEIA